MSSAIDFAVRGFADGTQYGQVAGPDQSTFIQTSAGDSLSLNLDADEPWPIWFKSPDGTVVSLSQRPGDAVAYLGCQTPHWREPYPGTSCAQVFLHYVFAFGGRAYAYFDKKRVR